MSLLEVFELRVLKVVSVRDSHELVGIPDRDPANSYLGRYDAPQSAFVGSLPLSDADSTFPPLQPIQCTDPAFAGPEWGILGFSCTEEIQLLVSVSPANNEFPTDKVTLLLISDGARAHLFVNAEGH